MTLFYNPSTGGFLDSRIIATIPADAVEITSDQHKVLLAALNSGGTVEIDDAGVPQAVAAPAPTLANVQSTLCAQIDDAADKVYNAIGSQSPGRLAEYRQAKDDATAYKAAGYSGAVPQTVQCWADAQGWTAQQAADDILSTSATWEAVLNGVRSARLKGKAAVTAATTTDDANTAAQTAIINVQQAGAGA